MPDFRNCSALAEWLSPALHPDKDFHPVVQEGVELYLNYWFHYLMKVFFLSLRLMS